MKRLLLIVLPLLLIVGCSSPEPINYETTLVERDDVYYTKDTNKPYSGQVFSLYDDGKKKGEGTLKDGKEDGKWTYFHSNGQKFREGTYKNEKEDGLWTRWYESGQKWEEGTFKDGKGEGLRTSWWENGQKFSEGNYKDSKPVGKWTHYNKDGTIKEVKEF